MVSIVRPAKTVQTARMHMLICVNDRRTNPKVHICHRGGKSTWPDWDSNPEPLAHRASTPANRATKPLGRPATISPCLNRFVPESARNHAGTDETVPLLLAARARTHTEPPNVTGRKKHMARPGLEPKTSRIPCEHSSQPSHRGTRSTCDIYMSEGTCTRPKLLAQVQMYMHMSEVRYKYPMLHVPVRSYIHISKAIYACPKQHAYVRSLHIHVRIYIYIISHCSHVCR